MSVERVASLDDPRLGDFAALNDPEARRRIERRGEHFIVEGPLALEQLLESSYEIRRLLVSHDALGRVRALLGRRDVEVLVVERELMEEVVGFDFHRGVLASAARRPLEPIADVVAAATRVLVAEGVNDHENVGALFRNAAALGAGAVLLDPTTADPLYRRSVRVSLGHVLRVPWTRAEPWPRALHELRSLGFVVLALTPTGDVALRDVAASQRGSRVALVLGAEGPGLSAEARELADRRVRIDMRPGVDSLNVATAAAVALHELT